MNTHASQALRNHGQTPVRRQGIADKLVLSGVVTPAQPLTMMVFGGAMATAQVGTANLNISSMDARGKESDEAITRSIN